MNTTKIAHILIAFSVGFIARHYTAVVPEIHTYESPAGFYRTGLSKPGYPTIDPSNKKSGTGPMFEIVIMNGTEANMRVQIPGANIDFGSRAALKIGAPNSPLMILIEPEEKNNGVRKPLTASF